VIAALYVHRMAVVWFLVVFAVFIVGGIFFAKKKK